MGKIVLLGARGDRETPWDPRDAKSTAAARKVFEHHSGTEFRAFEAARPGGEATLVKEFNPEAGEIVISRRLIGG